MLRGVMVVGILFLAVIAAVFWPRSGGQILAGTLILILILLVWTGARRSAESWSGSVVWDLIPREQYGGRHAESGGLARDEQEAALRAIKQRADEIDEHRRGR